MNAKPDPPQRGGRAKATTREELTHLGLELFIERGFDRTTVDDVAAAAGIGRRTFFRYFASKNDLPWGDFEALVEQMRASLAGVDPELPLMEALRRAVLEFNRFPEHERVFHRERMQLLLEVPTLVAHSTLRFAEWRTVIAEFAAARLGVPADSRRPQLLAWTLLAISLAGYEQWLRDEDANLDELLESAYAELRELLA